MAESPAKKPRLDADASLSTAHSAQPLPEYPTLAARNSTKSMPPSTKPAAKYTSNDMVSLLVGPKERKLLAFGHQLAKSSDFFKVALKKEWNEGQRRTIKLPEDSFVDLLRYLDFISSQELPSSHIKSHSELKACENTYEKLTDLYLLGEKLLDDRIRNAITTEFVRLFGLEDGYQRFVAPVLELVNKIYDGTPAESPLRSLMVDVEVYYDTELLSVIDPPPHPEFILDACQAFRERVVYLLNSHDRYFHPELSADDYHL